MSEPKFKPGDIIRKGDGREKVVISTGDAGVMLIEGSYHTHEEKDYELVFRPATRAETEALRKLAEACKRLDDAFNADTPYEQMKYQINDVVIVYREMKGE